MKFYDNGTFHINRQSFKYVVDFFFWTAGSILIIYYLFDSTCSSSAMMDDVLQTIFQIDLKFVDASTGVEVNGVQWSFEGPN